MGSFSKLKTGGVLHHREKKIYRWNKVYVDSPRLYLQIKLLM